MGELEHFSHPHPLVLLEIQKDEGGHKVICYGCKKQILGPAYSCSHCDYFLHKRCAELPLRVKDPIHQHLMRCFVNYFSVACDFCGDDGKRFIYDCLTCEFNICISCFMEDRRMITHKSHDHPLAFLLRPTSFFCNLCRMEHKYSSYVCVTCQFWIHKSCALLPTTIIRTDHHHPLILEQLYKFIQFETDCYICDERINQFHWAYHCFRCRCSIHVKCSSTSSSTPLRGRESETMDLNDHNLDVAYLPMNCLVEHLLLEKIEDEPMINHWSHEHYLTLFNVRNENETNDDKTILCDSCVQPISHPFYCCAQCDYFLHLNCANLPREIQHPRHQHPIQLSKSSEFYLLTRCESCDSYNNGFFYKCDTCEWFFRIDVKCALLPTSIVHEAHKHSLCQNKDTRTSDECSASGFFRYPHRFGCMDCHFALCYNCALLPKTVKHRWDRHPLILTYPPIFDHPEEFYCEICEREINTRYWIYYCRECDQSFHLRCIHRKYKNVKFGGSCEFEDHPHPLKFLQNAMKQFTCCRCGELSGDDPVFECLECYYMLCEECMERHDE